MSATFMHINIKILNVNLLNFHAPAADIYTIFQSLCTILNGFCSFVVLLSLASLCNNNNNHNNNQLRASPLTIIRIRSVAPLACLMKRVAKSQIVRHT